MMLHDPPFATASSAAGASSLPHLPTSASMSISPRPSPRRHDTQAAKAFKGSAEEEEEEQNDEGMSMEESNDERREKTIVYDEAESKSPIPDRTPPAINPPASTTTAIRTKFPQLRSNTQNTSSNKHLIPTLLMPSSSPSITTLRESPRNLQMQLTKNMSARRLGLGKGQQSQQQQQQQQSQPAVPSPQQPKRDPNIIEMNATDLKTLSSRVQRRTSALTAAAAAAAGGSIITSPSSSGIASPAPPSVGRLASMSILTQAQHVSNSMTMEELLSEAWRLHAKEVEGTKQSAMPTATGTIDHSPSAASLTSNTSSSTAATRHRGAIGDSSSSAANNDQPYLASSTTRSVEVSQFLRDSWSAILRDKSSSGVTLTTLHKLHSEERFIRKFRKVHENNLMYTRHVLDLSSVGLGPQSSRVMCAFVKSQGGQYSELRLSKNVLGDEGIRPILKLLKKVPQMVQQQQQQRANDDSLLAMKEVRRRHHQHSSSTSSSSSSRGRARTASSSSKKRSRSSTSHHRHHSSSLIRKYTTNEFVKSLHSDGTTTTTQSQLSSTTNNKLLHPLIRKLDISYNSLTPQAFVEIATVLPNSSLRVLDIGSDHSSGDQINRMGEEGGKAFAEALASLNCPLQVLRIAGVGSTGFHTLILHGLLKSCEYSQLLELNLKGNWLSNHSFLLLMRACITGMKNLTHLTLAKNRFSSQGALKLGEYVRVTKVLKYLDLSMCCLTGEMMVVVGGGTNAASTATSATTDPSSSATTTAAPATSTTATTTSSIISSSLPNPSHTRTSFFFYLIESMARNISYCSIEELILDENNIGDSGAKQLGLALALMNKHLKNLHKLSLVGCNMIELSWLSYGVSRNTNLTTLDLSSNPIGDGGSIALALALQGRLELDAPLCPIFTLCKPVEVERFEEKEKEGGKEEKEGEGKDEKKNATTDKPTIEILPDSEVIGSRPSTVSDQKEKDGLGENGSRPSTVHDKDKSTTAAVASSPSSFSVFFPSPVITTTSREEMNPDFLSSSNGLHKITSDEIGGNARNLRAVPKGGKLTIRTSMTMEGMQSTNQQQQQDQDNYPSLESTPDNIIYELPPQQLHAARMNNSKRVIIYTPAVRKSHIPVCSLLHLNLTHIGMSDSGASHFIQLIACNYSLKELVLLDNDLTTQSGILILSTLKNIPFERIKLIGLILAQNRIHTDILEEIQKILVRRRNIDHLRRLRSYKYELAKFTRLQRNKFVEFIQAISNAMQKDEELREELAERVEEFEGVREKELRQTEELERELEEIRASHTSTYSDQILKYDDSIYKRMSVLQVEQSKKVEILTSAHQFESHTLHKLSSDLFLIKSQIEQEKAESAVEERPFRVVYENEHRSLTTVKSNLLSLRKDKTRWEKDVLRVYYAILRNCGKGRAELLDPHATYCDNFQDALMAANNAGGGGGGLLSGSTSPTSSNSPPPVEDSAGISTWRSRDVHFLEDGTQPMGTFLINGEKKKRPLSPRLYYALRYLTKWATQGERENIQLRIIEHARNEGRPIEKMLKFRTEEYDRLSPRTRSAIQRLRGDVETEWERTESTALAARQAALAAKGGAAARKKKAHNNASTNAAAAVAAVPDPSSAVGGPASDGTVISLTIDLVTSLLQLAPLTKVQGSTTIFNMIMHGLNHGSMIYVTLNASPEADAMLAAWTEKYGEWKPQRNVRVRKSPQASESALLGASSSTSSLSSQSSSKPPAPLTFTCTSTATSSVLIKLVSERLNIPLSSINSLSYQENRAANGSSSYDPTSSSDLVRLIRERELKELAEKKKKQQQAKNSASTASANAAGNNGAIPTPSSVTTPRRHGSNASILNHASSNSSISSTGSETDRRRRKESSITSDQPNSADTATSASPLRLEKIDESKKKLAQGDAATAATPRKKKSKKKQNNNTNKENSSFSFLPPLNVSTVASSPASSSSRSRSPSSHSSQPVPPAATSSDVVPSSSALRTLLVATHNLMPFGTKTTSRS